MGGAPSDGRGTEKDSFFPFSRSEEAPCLWNIPLRQILAGADIFSFSGGSCAYAPPLFVHRFCGLSSAVRLVGYLIRQLRIPSKDCRLFGNADRQGKACEK